jgi:hypothetical protein
MALSASGNGNTDAGLTRTLQPASPPDKSRGTSRHEPAASEPATRARRGESGVDDGGKPHRAPPAAAPPAAQGDVSASASANAGASTGASATQ